MTVHVVQEACTGCGQCLLSCSANAVEVVAFISGIDKDNCTECLVCLDYCPHQAIKEK